MLLTKLSDCEIRADNRQKQIGYANRNNIAAALSALAIIPFTKRLSISVEDVETLVARAVTDAANQSLKAYFPM